MTAHRSWSATREKRQREMTPRQRAEALEARGRARRELEDELSTEARMTEPTPKQLPSYAGTGPKDRVRAFLDAVAATNEGRVRSGLAPAGLMGWRGGDGYYHELTEADLWALVGGDDA